MTPEQQDLFEGWKKLEGKTHGRCFCEYGDISACCGWVIAADRSNLSNRHENVYLLPDSGACWRFWNAMAQTIAPRRQRIGVSWSFGQEAARSLCDWKWRWVRLNMMSGKWECSVCLLGSSLVTIPCHRSEKVRLSVSTTKVKKMSAYLSDIGQVSLKQKSKQRNSNKQTT